MKEILQEIESAFFDIPFENSDFQNENFVLAAQHTPARAYRAIGLRMHTKLQAIQELKFARQLQEIDIEEKLEIINSESSSKFDKRRAQVEIDKIEAGRNYSDKLLNDAIHDLNFMYAQFKKFPKYTREQFEQEELLHFENSLRFQIESGGNGAKQSLWNIEHNHNLFPQLVDEAKQTLLENPCTSN